MTDIPTPQAPLDPRKVVRSVDADGNFVFKQVGIEEITFKGRFGAVVTSSSSNTIAIGDHYFTIDIDVDKFRIGDDVQITSLDDTDCYMWGEVIGKVTTVSPAQLRIYVDDISPLVGTFSNWEIQVVARPKPGIEKDVSTTSINPVTMTTGTFTVTASKFFPPGGKLLIKALADRSVIILGRVKAYNSTSLVVEKIVTTATVSQSYTSWSIALLDAPQDLLPKYGIFGLRITKNASAPTTDFDVAPGTVLDTTGAVNLSLTTNLTKQLDADFVAGTNQGSQTYSANLAGTITSAAAAVTGTGTNFRGDFHQTGGAEAFNTDFDDQLSGLGASSYTTDPYITSGGVSRRISATASDTALTTFGNLGVTGATYKRGGWVAFSAQDQAYAVVLARKDSDGTVDVFTCSFSGGGSVDLPSGYTYYRVIGRASFSTDSELIFDQPLRRMATFRADEISFEDFGMTYLTPDTTVQAAIETVDSTFVNFDDRLDDLETSVGPLASTTQRGFVELATSAETITGTDATLAVTPAGLSAARPFTETTYTPLVTLVGGAGNTVPVYVTNSGRYSIIGRLLFLDIVLANDGGAEGAGTGQMTLSLPVAPAQTNSNFIVGFAANGTTEWPIFGAVTAATALVSLNYQDVVANVATMTGAQQNSTTRSIRLKFWYEV